METTSIQNPHAIDSPRSGWAQLGRRLLFGFLLRRASCSTLVSVCSVGHISGCTRGFWKAFPDERVTKNEEADFKGESYRTENVVSESTNRPNISPKGYLETFILYLIVTSNVVLKTTKIKSIFLHANQKALNVCVCSGHIH